MATAVSRNAPCPCGSGKKYKQCCIDKAPPQARRRLLVPVALAVIAAALGVWLGITRGWSTGGTIGGGGLLLAAIVYVFYDPPPPRGDGSHPAGINFGS